MVPPWRSDRVSLNELRERLGSADLIPSQRPLLDDLADRLAELERIGVAELATLRLRLKSKAKRSALAGETGLDTAWLNLLRRAVEGFWPGPRKLTEYDWVAGELLESLARAGIKDTGKLLAAGPAETARATGLTTSDLDELYTLADLCRIQWVGPTFARVLLAAGYSTPAGVAAADPTELERALKAANAHGRYYKDAIGSRDIRRLIHAAAYVPPREA